MKESIQLKDNIINNNNTYFIFNKQNLITNYNNLSSNNSKTKEEANIYLLEFNKSQESLSIAIELLDDKSSSIQLLGSIILHNALKHKASYLIENVEEYKKYHQLIFHNLLEKYKHANIKVLERICFIMSFLMIIGIYNRSTTIEDILQFSQTSVENEQISLFILENIQKELSHFDEINNNYTFISTINEILNKSNTNIKEFITIIINKHITNNKNIVDHVLKLALSWTKIGMNIFDDIKFSKLLLNCFDSKFSTDIADIFIESIKNSQDAKLYYNEDFDNIEEIKSKWDINLILSITELIKFISTNIFSNDETTKSKNMIIISNLASIYSCIIDNYAYLLFIDIEDIPNIMKKLLMYFINLSTKNNCSKFKESLCSLRDFVIKSYRLKNLNVNEKTDFFNFIVDLIKGVLNHSLLKTLDIHIKKNTSNSNYNTDNLNNDCLHSNEIQFLDDCFEIPDEFPNIDEEQVLFISSEDFRIIAEDLFFNLHYIIISLFEDNGNKTIFEFLLNSYKSIYSNYTSNTISYDYYIKASESILLYFKSIVDIQELEENVESIYLLNTLQSMLSNDIQLLKNDRFVYSLLLFLDSSGCILHKNIDLCRDLITFLIQLVSNSNFELIACKIILGIVEWFDIPDKIIVNSIYDLYVQNYYKFSNNSIWYLVKSLCVQKGSLYCIDNVDIRNNSNIEKNINEEEILIVFTKVLEIPINSNLNSIKCIKNIISNNNLNNNNNSNNIKTLNNNISYLNLKPCEYSNLRLLIIKSMHSIELVFKEAVFLSSKTFTVLVDNMFNQNLEIFSLISCYLIGDIYLLNYILNIFIKVINNSKYEIANYFEFINKFCINIFTFNPIVGLSIVCLQKLWCYSILYNSTFENSSDNNNSNFKNNNKYAFNKNIDLSTINSNTIAKSKENQIFINNNLLKLFELIISKVPEIKGQKSSICLLGNSISLLINNRSEYMIPIEFKSNDDLLVFKGTIEFLIDVYKNANEELSLMKNILFSFSNLLNFSIIRDNVKSIIYKDILVEVLKNLNIVDTSSLIGVSIFNY